MKRTLVLVAGLFISAMTMSVISLKNNYALAAVSGVNTLVSVNNTGNGQGGNDESGASKISANGKHIAFHSMASNLVSGDTNNIQDVFVRDLSTQITSRVSVSTSGAQGNGHSSTVAISRTGRYILFSSNATNLIDGRSISSNLVQLYVRDMTTGTTSLVSQTSSSTVANADVGGLSISSDGRFVLFTTTATNLGPTVTNWPRNNLYMLDRSLSTFTILNTPSSGSAQNVNTANAAMSCDGSLVAFASTATNLVSGDTNGHEDIFLLDLRNGSQIQNITLNTNSGAVLPKISCSGDYIGFTSNASNLTSGVTSTSVSHVYTYDRVNGMFTLLDQSTSGSVANDSTANGSGSNLEVSDNGDAVFNSKATNLSTIGTGGAHQLYVRNVGAGTTEMLTVNTSGVAANSMGVMAVSISVDGKRATFFTPASNLISSDTNGLSDAFVAETGL